MFICGLNKVVSKTFDFMFCANIDSFCSGVIFIVDSSGRVSLIGTKVLLRFETYLYWQVWKMSSSLLL